MDALDYLKTLLDPDRLAVLRLIAAAPRTLPELTADAGGAERDVLVTLAPLLQAGLVARDGDRYRRDHGEYWRAGGRVQDV